MKTFLHNNDFLLVFLLLFIAALAGQIICSFSNNLVAVTQIRQS